MISDEPNDDACPKEPLDSLESARSSIEPAQRQLMPTLRRIARSGGIYLLFGVLVALLAEILLEAARTGWEWPYVGEFLTKDAGVMAIGALVLLLMTGVLLAVTGQMWLSATLVLGLVTFLGVASNLKFVVRREPLYPSDFAFIREPEFLLTMVEPRVLWLTLLGLVPIVAFSWGLGRLFKLWLRRRPSQDASSSWRTSVLVSRLAVGGLSVVMLSSLLQFNHHGNPWRRAFESAGAQWAKASQPVNYAHNGFLGGFLYNLDIPAMRRSSEYTRANMERIVAKYTADAEKLNKSRSPHALDDVNVVSVLSESFSDPTLLKGMKLAQDPIPRTRALMQRVPHGLMYSRKPGGGTSSVEFETLTGMSLAQFNPAMDTPYQMLIPNYPTFPSAVEMFNQMGHKTLAIHPFTGSMYQRDRVYPILGFSDFKDRTEMDYRGKVEENPYISDRAAFRQTLDAIDTQDQPVFVNLVTMQNHMPYRGKYADPIGIEGLDERDADLMSQYSRGLSYSDQAMSEFIQQLDRSREKTIIVFYGDHVPGGTPRSLFRKNTRLAMHQTPFFMYSNFGQVQPKEFPTTSPIYFLPNLFDMANAPLPPYYMLLREMERHITALEHRTMMSPKNKRLSPKTLSPEAREVLEDYKLVVYDLSVGQRYAEQMLYPTPAGTVAASGTPE